MRLLLRPCMPQGAIGSWFNPSFTYCDTLGLTFFEDISSGELLLYVPWGDLSLKFPGWFYCLPGFSCIAAT